MPNVFECKGFPLEGEPADSRGAIIILVSALLVVILAFVGIALSVSYRNVVQADLQATADATAFNSAAMLCSTAPCYDDAIRVAIQTIAGQKVHGRLSDSLLINLPVIGVPGWDLGAVRVRIERGHWWGANVPPGVRTHPNQPFEPFDNVPGAWIPADLNVGANSPYAVPDWAANHLGLKDFIAANAVYVRIERRNVGGLFNPFNPISYDTMAEAYALASPVGFMDVAPFALPICSLVSSTGNFDFIEQCGADRFFTETSRYCPAGPAGCDIVPGFLYSPDVNSISCSPVPNPPASQTCDGQKCNFEGPRFGKISEHFGVVGLPQNSGIAASEAGVQAVLRQVRPVVQTFIGDRFMVIDGGLTTPLSDQLLWDAIQGNGVPLSSGVYQGSAYPAPYNSLISTDADHPNFFATSMSSSGPSQIMMHFRMPDASCAAGSTGFGVCNSRLFSHGDLTDSDYCDGTATGSASGFGALGLTPSSAGSYPIEPTAAAVIIPSTGPSAGQTQLMNRVWYTTIPVIGDVRENSVDCSSNAFPDSSGIWIVVGTVKIYIYDTDIGNPPVQPPPPQPPAVSCAYTTERSPFGFTKGYGPAGGCNLVRARTPCTQTFIPAVDPTKPTSPRLILAPT